MGRVRFLHGVHFIRSRRLGKVIQIMQQFFGWARCAFASLPYLLIAAGCRPQVADSSPQHGSTASMTGTPAIGAAAPRAESLWPGGAQAAVSLTYDDNMESQLAPAAAHLDQAGLHGTFFLNEIKDDAPWRALRERGHELGGHTLHHPCPRSLDVPTTPSEDLDLAKMRSELDGDVAQLQRLGQPPPFSFAYPCGVTWVGAHQSYVDLVRARFSAARLASDEGSSDVADPHMIPAQFGLLSSAELERAVQRAVDEGRWLVLGFHGIGSGWLITDAQVHEQLVLDLAARKDVWVAPFGVVAQYLATRRGR